MFTERTLKIFIYAELEAEKTGNIVYPIHILLAILKEHAIYEDQLLSLTDRILNLENKTDEPTHDFYPFKNRISQNCPGKLWCYCVGFNFF